MWLNVHCLQKAKIIKKLNLNIVINLNTPSAITKRLKHQTLKRKFSNENSRCDSTVILYSLRNFEETHAIWEYFWVGFSSNWVHLKTNGTQQYFCARWEICFRRVKSQKLGIGIRNPWFYYFYFNENRFSAQVKEGKFLWVLSKSENFHVLGNAQLWRSTLSLHNVFETSLYRFRGCVYDFANHVQKNKQRWYYRNWFEPISLNTPKHIPHSYVFVRNHPILQMID